MGFVMEFLWLGIVIQYYMSIKNAKPRAKERIIIFGVKKEVRSIKGEEIIDCYREKYVTSSVT